MYSNYYNYPVNTSKINPNFQGDWNNDRIIGGGFIGPFLLGGLAGAALSPGFGFRPRPYPYNYYYPYPAYPYYPYPRYYY